jgi:hypothetical protein
MSLPIDSYNSSDVDPQAQKIFSGQVVREEEVVLVKDQGLSSLRLNFEVSGEQLFPKMVREPDSPRSSSGISTVQSPSLISQFFPSWLRPYEPLTDDEINREATEIFQNGGICYGYPMPGIDLNDDGTIEIYRSNLIQSPSGPQVLSVLIANDIKAVFDGLTGDEQTKVIENGFMVVKNEPFWGGSDSVDLSPDELDEEPFTIKKVRYSFQRKAKFSKGILFIQLKILSFEIEDFQLYFTEEEE